MNSRRKGRELALRALYAYEMTGNSIDQIIEDMVRSHDTDKRVKLFTEGLVKASVEHREEADKYISGKAQNWEFQRIAVLDKLIMRMAICELLFFEDIPPKVSIDEAIEIAKKYSTENSGKFINGILDSILIDLKRQNILNKTGRGLHD